MDDLLSAAAYARRSDPDTSRLAADEVAPRIRELQATVLAFAAERSEAGFIDPDLNDYFGCQSSTYRTRRSELCAMLLIEDSGVRVSIGGKGRKFIVWRITGKGQAERSRLLLASLDRAA